MALAASRNLSLEISSLGCVNEAFLNPEVGPASVPTAAYSLLSHPTGIRGKVGVITIITHFLDHFVLVTYCCHMLNGIPGR